MENLKKTIGENLLKLRKSKNMTQLEFAKTFNFSDKAISRWERGEAMPDIEVLCQISNYFDISLDELVGKCVTDEIRMEEVLPTLADEIKGKVERHKKFSIALLWISAVWIVLSLSFTYCMMFLDYQAWWLYIWGVPISTVVFMFFDFKWNLIKKKYILHSTLLWTLLLSIYLQTIHLNLWLIFVVGIPIQVSIYLFNILKK